jgi:hypothetical protein
MGRGVKRQWRPCNGRGTHPGRLGRGARTSGRGCGGELEVAEWTTARTRRNVLLRIRLTGRPPAQAVCARSGFPRASTLNISSQPDALPWSTHRRRPCDRVSRGRGPDRAARNDPAHEIVGQTVRSRPWSSSASPRPRVVLTRSDLRIPLHLTSGTAFLLVVNVLRLAVGSD